LSQARCVDKRWGAVASDLALKPTVNLNPEDQDSIEEDNLDEYSDEFSYEIDDT
jgi:hypothetical protein